MTIKANFVLDLILKLIIWGFLLLLILTGVGFFFVKLPPTIKTSADYVRYALNMIFDWPLGTLITIFLIIVPAIILVFNIRKFLMKYMGKS
jgi:hypothetical protein